MIQATLKRVPNPIAPEERQRISSVLINDDSQGFDSMAALPSNIRAIESALLFSSGFQTFAALVGPSGWGKSHLLEAAAVRLSRRRSVSVMTAEQWISEGLRTDPSKPLILDNVQDVLSKKRMALPLRLALERRIRAGRPTLLSFTAPKLNRQIKAFLPQSRDWVLATISEPAICERSLIVRQMAATECLLLSDELVSLLSRRLKGNGRTIQGALKRLRLSRDRWTGDVLTLEACGVLSPLFDNSSTWDLRDHILETAERHPRSCNRRELIAYAMIKVALLPETEVASYMQLKQADVYGLACCFDRKRRSCEDTEQESQQFIQEVVRGL